MQKRFSVATAGFFAVVSYWCGFKSGRKSGREDLNQLIETLRRSNSNPYPTSLSPPKHSCESVSLTGVAGASPCGLIGCSDTQIPRS